MTGTPRGRQLYAIMADGGAVPNEVINDLLAEAMVKKADSKVSEIGLRKFIFLVKVTFFFQKFPFFAVLDYP